GKRTLWKAVARLPGGRYVPVRQDEAVVADDEAASGMRTADRQVLPAFVVEGKQRLDLARLRASKVERHRIPVPDLVLVVYLLARRCVDELPGRLDVHHRVLVLRVDLLRGHGARRTVCGQLLLQVVDLPPDFAAGGT